MIRVNKTFKDSVAQVKTVICKILHTFRNQIAAVVRWQKNINTTAIRPTLGSNLALQKMNLSF